jgi:acetyl-CoA acyltransferase
MREVVIIDAVRTPIGKVRGALSQVRPDDLLATALASLVRRVGVDPKDLDEVVSGCANQAGEDNRNVARMATLLADFPYEVPALTVNRLCASGLAAVVQASRAIRAGDHELVIAAGVESMSRAPWSLAKPEVAQESGNRTAYDTALGWRFPNPRLEKRFPLETMGETAENLASRYALGRAAQDELALESHARAVLAQKEGAFADELVAVEIATKGGVTKVDRDEGPRADTSLDKLGSLKPAFRKDGSVTAGNSSTLNDGAAALLLASPEAARRLGKKPLGRIVANASAGVDPRVMGIGPVPATKKALERAGWKLADVELTELNEAFAAQVLAVLHELPLAKDRINVRGGAIALGHPLGASGARILTTLVHAMRARGAKRGLASLCVGVGQGESVLVEV